MYNINYNVNFLIENLLKVQATDHRKIQEEVQRNPLKNPGSRNKISLQGKK